MKPTYIYVYSVCSVLCIQYIQSSVAGTKAQDAEALKAQQELIHITAFAKKQQLEQAEALASLKNRISSTGSFAEEMTQLRQMNVSLTGELEDYRTQTRRLLEDLRQKEEEIGELKGALSERGPQSSDVSVVCVDFQHF